MLGDGHLIAGGFDGFEDLRCAAPFVAQQDDKKRASLCALLQPGEQHRQRDDSDHEDWEERQRIPRGPGRPERQVRILCPPRSGRQGVLCTGDLESSPRDLGSLRIVCLVFASSADTSQEPTRVTSEAGVGGVSEKLASHSQGNLVVGWPEQARAWRIQAAGRPREEGLLLAGSGSTANSSGEPLRVVAKPIREPSGDHCGLSSSPGESTS